MFCRLKNVFYIFQRNGLGMNELFYSLNLANDWTNNFLGDHYRYYIIFKTITKTVGYYDFGLFLL